MDVDNDIVSGYEKACTFIWSQDDKIPEDGYEYAGYAYQC